MRNEIKFLMYRADDESVSVNAVVKDESVWLTQKAMAELFGCTTDNVSLHLKNIYLAEELSLTATTEEISVVQKEGNRTVKRKILFYNLDVIISVGYRVNSHRATQFRIWATKVLKDKGEISRKRAEEKAESEYDEFNKKQKIISDFDKEIKKLMRNNDW